ncbi:MAG: hypothetical protein PHU03_03825, partial [Syntrophales bacterium]|nr:hypothetical protein [Syntrophales bacterium]
MERGYVLAVNQERQLEMSLWNDQSMKAFGLILQRLIMGEDLTREESYGAFRKILLNEQPELHQGAFLAALASKGETAAEIAGAWAAIVELDTVAIETQFEPPLMENSGTGMDSLKTFNVSSAAAIIAAAAGLRVARHGSRALTSSCGTVDILEAVGIDVDCDVQTVEKSIGECGIGIFNGMSPKVHPRSLSRILSRIRFGSTLNIAASLASPCRPTHALRGVYSKAMVGKAAQVLREIGCRRTMVAYGTAADGIRGMDEISNIGETFIHESFPDGREATYVLSPEEVGLPRRRYEEIAATGRLDRE